MRDALEVPLLTILGANVRGLLCDGDWHARRRRDGDSTLRDFFGVLVLPTGDVVLVVR